MRLRIILFPAYQFYLWYLSVFEQSFGLSSLLALIGDSYQWDEAHVYPQRHQRIISIVFYLHRSVPFPGRSSLMSVPVYFYQSFSDTSAAAYAAYPFINKNYKFYFGCQKILKFSKRIDLYIASGAVRNSKSFIIF